jgi:hypothetical protein
VVRHFKKRRHEDGGDYSDLANISQWRTVYVMIDYTDHMTEPELIERYWSCSAGCFLAYKPVVADLL